MNTSIKILGWEAEGLRCPDQKLNFEMHPDEPWPVTLIQMPNGTGKTTALNLLRGTLSGAFEDRTIWPKDKIRQLQKKDFDDDTGYFRVDLSVSGKRLTIVVDFDFGEGTVEYKTSFGSGQKVGFEPPTIVRRFFRSGFVNFFAFDGELAEQLLSYDHTNAETAIEDLFQLGVFNRIVNAIHDYWESQTASRTATEQRGYSRRQKRVQWLRKRLDELKHEQEEKLRDRDEIVVELAKVKEQFSTRISANQEKAAYLQEKERDFQESKSAVLTLTRDLLRMMRLPVALSATFATEVLTFKNSLDRAKLPESAAKEFFEDLVNEALCVCGREMDAKARESVKERAAQYLGSEEVSLLNALKSDVDQYLGGNSEELRDEIGRLTKEIAEETRRRQHCRNELEVAKHSVSADDPELGSAQERINSLEIQVKGVEEEIEKYENPDERYKDENTLGIVVLQRRLDDAERKLAEITHTIELKEKRDLLEKILRTAHNNARERLIADVVKESNSRIKELIPHNNIRIRDIEHCLKLEGQEGGSVGETLCVAYAFLSTLFTKTKHELPFVVDSPAGSIDLRVREQVAELVPKLSHQFIAFIISAEREGFLDSLEDSVGSKIQYVTLFRSSIDNAGISVDGSDQLVESDDGKVVIGRHYFRGFHIDREEE